MAKLQVGVGKPVEEVLRQPPQHQMVGEIAERMAQQVPRGKFVEIPRAVHTLHEDNPDAVLAALKEFLGF